MGSGCCSRLIRVVVISLNVLFFAIGTTLLAVGIYLQVNENTISYVVSNAISGAVILILTGAILTIAGLIGVLGASLSWLPLIITYIFVVLIVIIIELTAGMLAFTSYAALKGKVEGYMLNAIENYPSLNSPPNEAAHFANYFQKEFKCCGYHNSSDWLGNKYFNSSKTLPNTCCNSTTCDHERHWTAGCGTYISKVINIFSLTLGIVAIVVVVAQVLSLLLVICLCAWKIHKRRKKTYKFELKPISKTPVTPQ